MLFKSIVLLFALAFVAKILFFRKKEKFGRIANQFANMFLIAIGIYIVVLGVFQIF